MDMITDAAVVARHEAARAAGKAPGTTAEGGKSKGGSPDQHSAAVHVRFPFGRMRQARIAAKAASER